MKRLFLVTLFLFSGCAMFKPKPTVVSVKPDTGEITMSNDVTVAHAPSIESKRDGMVIPAPGGTKMTVQEYSKPQEGVVQQEVKRTTFEFPEKAGAEIRIMSSDTKAIGSVGHTPPPPPSPFEKSLSYWTYAGIGIFLLGVFFATPWGGSNYRVGALICVGGLIMSLLGVFLDKLAKYNIPGWIPALGFVGVGAAIFLYWGYMHRQKQITTEEATPKVAS